MQALAVGLEGPTSRRPSLSRRSTTTSGIYGRPAIAFVQACQIFTRAGKALAVSRRPVAKDAASTDGPFAGGRAVLPDAFSGRLLAVPSRGRTRLTTHASFTA